jgi:hypothetical protein
MLLMPDVDMVVGTMLDPSALSRTRVHYDEYSNYVSIRYGRNFWLNDGGSVSAWMH